METFLLGIQEDLKKKAAKSAELDCISLAKWIRNAIREKLARELKPADETTVCRGKAENGLERGGVNGSGSDSSEGEGQGVREEPSTTE